MSRIRGPYVRFCERDEAKASPYSIAEKVFKMELAKQGYKEQDYREIVQISQPFGMYISNNYIAKDPQFMERLNQAIKKMNAK